MCRAVSIRRYCLFIQLTRCHCWRDKRDATDQTNTVPLPPSATARHLSRNSTSVGGKQGKAFTLLTPRLVICSAFCSRRISPKKVQFIRTVGETVSDLAPSPVIPQRQISNYRPLSHDIN